MARVIATDLDGELSQNGALTNPLFTRSGNRASVGDVGTCTIKTDTAGWESLGFTLGCTAGLSLSLDGVTYASDGASLLLGDIDSTGTLVYVKASSVAAGTVSLLLEQSGLVYTASTDVTVVADLLTLSASTNASTQSGTASIAADTLTATASLPDVTVDVAGSVNATVSADLLTATTAMQAPAPSGGAAIAAGLLTATSALQAPTVSVPAAGLANGTYYFRNNNGTLDFSTSVPGGDILGLVDGGTGVPGVPLYAGFSGAQTISANCPTTLNATMSSGGGGQTVITLAIAGAATPSQAFTLPSAMGANKSVLVHLVWQDDEGYYYIDEGANNYIVVSDA